MATTHEYVVGVPFEAGVFELAAESALVGIFCIAGGRCVYVNPRLREITGLHGDTSTADDWAKVIHPDDTARVFAAWWTAAQGGRPFAEEYRYLRPDGTVVWVQSEARRANGLVGGFPAFVGTLTDITARKRIELELAQSEERLCLALRGSRDLPWDWNLVTNEFCFVFPQCEAILGYRAGDLPPDRDAWERLQHPDDNARVKQTLEVAFNDGSSTFETEFRLLHKDGHYVPVLSRGLIGRDATGRPVRVSGTKTDLTERKRYEADLLAARHQLEATLAAIPDLLFELTLDGRFMSFHSTRVELFIVPPEEFLGKRIVEILPPEGAEICMSALHDAQVHGYSTGKQISLHLPQGHHWFELSVARKDGPPGEPPRFIVLSRDITVRKREQEALARASAEKDVLLAELHHRVKNTLQLVVSLLNLQIRAASDGSRAALSESRDRVMTIASAYTGLFDGLPDMDTNLVKYLTEVAQQLRINYAVAGREVGVTVATNDVQLSIDRDRAVTCGLILTELVSNALKHAFLGRTQGTISVTVSREAQSVRISVADDGVGFPAGHDQSTARGLGTQIICALAGQLSGTVTLETGGPTRIIVAFPLQRG